MSKSLEYTVILEKGTSSYGVYVPDLPGCVAVGETEAEALQLIEEAIALHLEDMNERNLPAPEPRSIGRSVTVLRA